MIHLRKNIDDDVPKSLDDPSYDMTNKSSANVPVMTSLSDDPPLTNGSKGDVR